MKRCRSPWQHKLGLYGITKMEKNFSRCLHLITSEPADNVKAQHIRSHHATSCQSDVRYFPEIEVAEVLLSKRADGVSDRFGGLGH
jgi:hypothetical protein